MRFVSLSVAGLLFVILTLLSLVAGMKKQKKR
jgi:hypothetical protein